ncbi:unnamed protein product [Rhodiola kirilowii]
MFYLTGSAISWFQWMHLTHQISGWESFRTDLKSRFGPVSVYKPEVLINMLHQTASITHYITEFEAISTRTPCLSTDNLMYHFLAGLRPDVHHDLLLLNPTSLQAIIGMARVAEQKNNQPQTHSPILTPFSKPYTPSPVWTPHPNPYTKPPPHTKHHFLSASSPQPR